MTHTKRKEVFELSVRKRDNLVFIVGYDKRFKGYRFMWSTGNYAPKKFNPQKPGQTLKTLLDIANQALQSLDNEGTPVNNDTLRARIELIRNRVGWHGTEIHLWAGKEVKVYSVPESVNRELVAGSLNKELLEQRPDFSGVMTREVSGGAKELLGFWQRVLDGEITARNGKKLRPSTIKAKRQTFQIVLEFQEHTGESLTFASMNRDFYNRFTKWMAEEREKDDEKKLLDSNTIGRHIKELKAILNLARENELITDDRYSFWPVTREKNEVVTLTKEELLSVIALQEIKVFDGKGKVIETRPLTDTEKDVRDIFCLACFLGPRISDFKKIREENFSVRAGVGFYRYVQEKTGQLVEIPVHSIAQEILDRRGGKFPRMISEQNFRYYLKDICRSADLNDRVIVKIRDGKPVYAKKWEAISPHTARRTFASNLFFGWFGKPMPASLCMRYTGHKTEKSFMLYIGATDTQLNEMALRYFDVQPKMVVS